MRPHIILVLAIIGIFIALIAVNVIFGNINRISEAADDLGNVHALIMLEDGKEVVSAQFVIINTRTKRAALLDLPPYLGVIVDRNNSLDRIDTLIAANNFNEYISEVETFTEKEIDFYLRFDIERFSAFVDLLEGVRLFIISTPNDEQILPSGDVVLDGHKIKEYIALYRQQEDSRIQIEGLQMLILRTLLTISEQKNYLDNNDILNYIGRITNTNLRQDELRTLLTDIIYGTDDNNVQTWFVQGDVRSITVDDRRESLLFPDLNGRWIADTVVQIENQLTNTRAIGSGNESVRIRILNGTPTRGLARRTKLLYEQFGYTAITIDNYQTQTVETTQIIDYGAPPEAVGQLAAVINIDEKNITSASNEGITEYDIALIIGSDFDGVKIQ